MTDKREICGTAYRKEKRRPSIGLRSLKHKITEGLNNGLTFEEIYEFDLDGERVVAFQIPPCEFASPTTWRGIPWSREDSSLKEMPRFKLEAIWDNPVPTGQKGLHSKPISMTSILMLSSSHASATLTSTPLNNLP